MKISNSKKQLAKIIHENGGWREGAEFTAQDGDGTGSIDFFKSKPRLYRGDIFWKGDYDCDDRIERTGVTIKNWHQTILSRDEYFHLHPVAETAPEPEIQSEIMGIAQVGDINVVESKPTIEQLAADYHNRKDYAERKQQEADEANAAADAALCELERAGEALGLLIGITKPATEPELVITDWRHLQKGDIVWWSGDYKYSSGEYQVHDIEKHYHTGSCVILLDVGGCCRQWIDHEEEEWRFIRRPTKGGADA